MRIALSLVWLELVSGWFLVTAVRLRYNESKDDFKEASPLSIFLEAVGCRRIKRMDSKTSLSPTLTKVSFGTPRTCTLSAATTRSKKLMRECDGRLRRLIDIRLWIQTDSVRSRVSLCCEPLLLVLHQSTSQSVDSDKSHKLFFLTTHSNQHQPCWSDPPLSWRSL